MRIFIVLAALLSVACSRTTHTTGTYQPPPAPRPPAKTDTPSKPTPPGKPSTPPPISQNDCKPVDPTGFLEKVNGNWQTYRLGMTGPDCTLDTEKQQVNRVVLAFNKYAKTVEVYRTTFGTLPDGVQACKSSPLGSGARTRAPSPKAVDLCQTQELINKYGENFYFLKDDYGLYRVVGTTTDSLKRTILLGAGSISSSPALPKGLLGTYINHDDYRSVDVEIPQ